MPAKTAGEEETFDIATYLYAQLEHFIMLDMSIIAVKSGEKWAAPVFGGLKKWFSIVVFRLRGITAASFQKPLSRGVPYAESETIELAARRPRLRHCR